MGCAGSVDGHAGRWTRRRACGRAPGARAVVPPHVTSPAPKPQQAAAATTQSSRQPRIDDLWRPPLAGRGHYPSRGQTGGVYLGGARPALWPRRLGHVRVLPLAVLSLFLARECWRGVGGEQPVPRHRNRLDTPRRKPPRCCPVMLPEARRVGPPVTGPAGNGASKLAKPRDPAAEGLDSRVVTLVLFQYVCQPPGKTRSRWGCRLSP